MPGLTNYVTTDTPSITITAVTGATVQVLVNGTEVATATEGSTAGQYTVSIPADELQVGNNSITTTAAEFQRNIVAIDGPDVDLRPQLCRRVHRPGQHRLERQRDVQLHIAQMRLTMMRLAIYVVSDSAGAVNGIAPGSPGYSQAALSSATVLFSGATQLARATRKP